MNMKTEMTVEALVQHIVAPVVTGRNCALKSCRHLKEDSDGFLTSSGIAESMELEVTDTKKRESVGKRKSKKPKPFRGEALWDQNSDSESEVSEE